MTEASRHFILLSCYFFLADRRVPPGEYGFTSSDGDPGTNGVISKTRCGAWNKENSSDFASGEFGGTAPQGAAASKPPYKDKRRSRRPPLLEASQPSMTSSDSSVDVDLFGKCAA